jgi:hypothetical protein
VNREDFVQLLSPAGQALLAQIGELDAKADVLQLVSSLRGAGHDAALVAAVLSQAKLRRRARAKFGEFATQMLFTEDGLEQASRLNVAAQHAGRFRSAGIEHVADLGCGIGAESLALAGLGIRVSAFEIDEVTAAVAQYNLNPFDNASVTQADVTDPALDLGQFDALFFDPARRELGGPRAAAAKRKFNPADYSPNFDWVLEQAAKKPTGIKLGPGHPHEGIPANAEAQWVSVNGDLVELGLWFGPLARESVARSVLLLADGQRHEFNSASSDQQPAEVGPLGEYVYEPDAGIIRGHLIGELAAQLGLRALDPAIAYLTGETHQDAVAASPWLRGYRVLDEMAFDRKKLKAYLRERSIGILEIKKRGVDVTPEKLRAEMQLKGEGAATLILVRVGDAHRVLVTEPIR